jgi:hypothetical protein
MAINKLYISHSKFDWAGNKSKLLDNGNLKKALAATESVDYHTSIADVQFENIQTMSIY